MALPQEKFYTVEDIYELPDGERAELLMGKSTIWLRQAGNTKDLLFH